MGYVEDEEREADEFLKKIRALLEKQQADEAAAKIMRQRR